MDSDWLRLTLAVLATWRLSRLVAYEDGPWDVVALLRRRAGDGAMGRLMDCPYCLSIWFAAPLALAVDAGFPGWLLAWLGVSGGASLIEALVSRGEPIVADNAGVAGESVARPGFQRSPVADGPRVIPLMRLGADDPARPNASDSEKAGGSTDPRTARTTPDSESSDVLLWEPARRGALRGEQFRANDRHAERPENRPENRPGNRPLGVPPEG